MYNTSYNIVDDRRLLVEYNNSNSIILNSRDYLVRYSLGMIKSVVSSYIVLVENSRQVQSKPNDDSIQTR